MEMVLLTALGVGGATVIGSVIGFIFKKISHKFSDIVLSFAAGVMLAAAVLGLIIPSVEYGGKYGIIVTVAGIFTGAVCLNLIDRLVPHLHKMVGADIEPHSKNANLDKVLLFVIAIAIHNLPEGIAAGVGFGSGDVSQAFLIAGGIALQNIPEGLRKENDQQITQHQKNAHIGIHGFCVGILPGMVQCIRQHECQLQHQQIQYHKIKML